VLPKFRDFIKSTPEEAAAKEADLVACLKGLNDYMAEKGPYIGGEAPCATDCAVMPRLYHMQVSGSAHAGLGGWPGGFGRGRAGSAVLLGEGKGGVLGDVCAGAVAQVGLRCCQSQLESSSSILLFTLPPSG